MQIKKQLALILCSLLFSVTSFAFSSITFHSVEQGRQAIIDESFEPYFSLLQPMEMQAKTAGRVKQDKLQVMRNNTRKVYQQAVLSFSAEDKETLTWYTRHYSKILNKSYPLLAKTPWKFVKLKNYIEGALPHTRGDTIVLHEAMLNRLSQAKSIQGEQALQGAGTVLVHELVHVAQRQNINAFHKLYKQWGFRKVKLESDNAWMKQHQLINPDGVNLEWIYPINIQNQRNWILPVVSWNEVTWNESEGNALRQMPRDFRMRAISVQKKNGTWEVTTTRNAKPVMARLSEQEPLLRAFPGVHGLYHPNEIAAEMIVSMMVFDNYVDHTSLDPRIVKAWGKVFSPVRQAVTN